MKKRGIFFKVFLYTMLFLLVVISVTAALFSQQVVSFYNSAQMRMLNENYMQLTEHLSNADGRELIEIAREFADKNQSYNFMIQDPRGRMVFASVQINNVEEPGRRHNLIMTFGSGYTLSALADTMAPDDYSQLWGRIYFALAILLMLSILGAILFARQMTRPIKNLVADAETMSKLKPVSPPAKRNDEIGELSVIVHDMYGKLKDTIADLEEEKETQRYFFAAASHELKTPIAAATALLQGMFDNVGDFKDHPKYLWECLKMMGEQNKIISEILEIVKLTDNKLEPNYEPLRLLDVVTAVLPLYQTLTEKKEQTVDVQIPGDLMCVADYGMLNRALSNIILNAMQNAPDGGAIRIWSEPGGEFFVRLCVLNAGTQIDKEMLPKLFNPFFRVDEARTMSHGRSGLGLTIVAKTLDCMKLSYALENTADGVMFWMDLPVSDDET
jgi:two-component system sensor histidine kinase VanS